MGLDLTSFVLEILNFLVLLWLLKRFLYGPVQVAIAKRQQDAAAAQAALAAAQQALVAQQTALADERKALTAQRDTALAQITTEVEAERNRRLQVLDTDMVAERLKQQARLAAQAAQHREGQDRAAAERADSFLRTYLDRLAGPALERAVIRLFLDDLHQMPAEQRGQLSDVPSDITIGVATAFDADSETRQQVATALAALLGRPTPLQWSCDPTVVAGIRIRLDGHLLEASLARALDAFRTSANTAATANTTP